MIQFFSAYDGVQLLAVIVAYVLVLLISLSLHEYAHAYVAYKQGDPTPKTQGRLTLNPMAHIDLMGFLLILLFGFGWAKPVNINPINFRNYKKGRALVSLSGIIMNFILAFVSFPLLFLANKLSGNNFAFFLQFFFTMMVLINAMLVIFNLIPIYPLDGFRVVEAFAKYGNPYVNFMRKYGTIILIALIIILNIFNLFNALINLVIMPISLFWNLILGLF